ncbi:MAG: septum site-determining protein MinC [Gammaproteobacteria bacterium]|nr:septum site-determining protein MinC [Gammaproteobacteria bacterium]
MKKISLQFKNSLPNLTIVEIHSQDIDELQKAVRDTIKQAPMMFIGMQVVLDCRALIHEEFTLPVKELKDFLTGEGLSLIAIMSDSQQHRASAVAQGVGAIPYVAQIGEKRKLKVAVADDNNVGVDESPQSRKKIKIVSNNEPRKLNDDTQTTAPVPFENKVVNHPVRSGQRIYSRGDLTIVGSVSAGAEVIADGNIHVYGSLRGRAIAGAQGNENARIFCHKLDAELISIAGNYKPNEDINDEYRNKNVQIALEGEKICFLTL